ILESHMKTVLVGALLLTPLVAFAHSTETQADASRVTPTQLVGKLKAKDKMHSELGALGSSQGSSDKVRKFGDKVASDTSKLEDALSDYANAAKITMADADAAYDRMMGDAAKAEPGTAKKSWKAEHQEKLDKIRAMKGAAFD